MPYEFKVPSLGESVESADVANIMVSEGDTISEDQEVIEVETGKAAMPVPSPVAGTIKKIKIAAGDTVEIGQVIMLIDREGAAAPDSDTAADDEKEAADEEQEDQSDASEAENEEQEDQGDASEAEDEEQKDKPKKKKEAAQTAEKPKKSKPAVESTESKDFSDAPLQLAPASPATRRFAREIGVDISKVSGSAEGGRISIEDVKAYAKSLNSRLADAPAGELTERPLPDFSKYGEVDYQRMSSVRATAATHLSYAFHVIPHVTQYDEADITEFEEQRKKLQKRVDKQGGEKLTVTALLLKICALALRRYPSFNTSVDMPNQSIYVKNYVNIGIAVDTPRGLMVPVVRACDEKNLIELTNEVTELSGRAREGRLTLDEMQGGCFTISNLGGIGGTHFTPIINWPEVAILGVSRAKMEPVWNAEDGEFRPRLNMPLCLSYDHRVIDGADGARFMRWICEAIENPMLVLLET